MDCIWSWAAELELGMAEVRPEAVPEAGSPEATLEKKEEDCEVAGGDSCDCGVPEEEVVKGYRPPEPGTVIMKNNLISKLFFLFSVATKHGHNPD